jgi:hypothetical protein
MGGGSMGVPTHKWRAQGGPNSEKLCICFLSSTGHSTVRWLWRLEEPAARKPFVQEPVYSQGAACRAEHEDEVQKNKDAVYAQDRTAASPTYSQKNIGVVERSEGGRNSYQASRQQGSGNSEFPKHHYITEEVIVWNHDPRNESAVKRERILRETSH